jgi:hypothetical protein
MIAPVRARGRLGLGGSRPSLTELFTYSLCTQGVRSGEHNSVDL